jgi:hypothetical protein
MARDGFQISGTPDLRAGMNPVIRPGARRLVGVLTLALALGHAPGLAQHDGHAPAKSSASCRVCQLSAQLVTGLHAPLVLLVPQGVLVRLGTLPEVPYRRLVYGVRSERAPPPTPSELQLG